MPYIKPKKLFVDPVVSPMIIEKTKNNDKSITVKVPN